eukprot:SAG31_NODE_384_length_16414_cov_7.492308_9_plen_67_part_00
MSWTTVRTLHKEVLKKICVRDDAWVAETVKTQRSVTEEEQYILSHKLERGGKPREVAKQTSHKEDK